MLPKGLFGLYFLKNKKLNFYSISFSYNKIRRLYILSEKCGEIGGIYNEKKYKFISYKNAYNFAETEVYKRKRCGYVLEPVNAIELDIR